MVTSFAVAKNLSPLVEDIEVLYEVGRAYNVGIHVHLAVGNPENGVQPKNKKINSKDKSLFRKLLLKKDLIN